MGARGFVLLAALLTGAGCASVVGRDVLLTPDLIGSEGTRLFAAQYAQVFTAAEAGVQKLGFEIARSELQSGIIVSKERSRPAAASGMTVSREYFTLTVELEIHDNTHVQVKAIPRRFLGIEKTETESRWSEQWLSHHWGGLFDDMAASLRVPALLPGQSRGDQQPERVPLVIGR